MKSILSMMLLLLIASSGYGMSARQLAKPQQDFNAALRAGNWNAAQAIINSLPTANRAIANQWRLQLLKAQKDVGRPPMPPVVRPEPAVKEAEERARRAEEARAKAERERNLAEELRAQEEAARKQAEKREEELRKLRASTIAGDTGLDELLRKLQEADRLLAQQDKEHIEHLKKQQEDHQKEIEGINVIQQEEINKLRQELEEAEARAQAAAKSPVPGIPAPPPPPSPKEPAVPGAALPADAGARIVALEEAVQKSNQENVRLRKQNEALRNDLRGQLPARGAASPIIDKLREQAIQENQRLQSQLNKLQHDYKNAQDSLAKANKDIETLKLVNIAPGAPAADVARLQEEIRTLKGQLDDAKLEAMAELADANQAIEELIKNNEELAKRLKDLEDK